MDTTVDLAPSRPVRLGGSVRGVIRLDLRSDTSAADRLALRDTAGWWPGARVQVDVGSRARVPASTVSLLAEQLDRVHLEVVGTAGAVRAWLLALADQRELIP